MLNFHSFNLCTTGLNILQPRQRRPRQQQMFGDVHVCINSSVDWNWWPTNNWLLKSFWPCTLFEVKSSFVHSSIDSVKHMLISELACDVFWNVIMQKSGQSIIKCMWRCDKSLCLINGFTHVKCLKWAFFMWTQVLTIRTDLDVGYFAYIKWRVIKEVVNKEFCHIQIREWHLCCLYVNEDFWGGWLWDENDRKSKH